MTATDVVALIIIAGEWTGLARAAIGSPVYAGLLDVLLIAVAGAVVLKRRRSLPRPIALDFAVGIFAVIAIVEMANPNVPSVGVAAEGFRKTAFTIIGYFIIRFAGSGNPLRFLSIFAVGSLPAVIFAIRQFMAPIPIDLAIISSSGASPISFHAGPVLRAFSPMAGPFHLGIISASVIVIATTLTKYRDRRWIVAAIIGSIGLVLSLTRANIVATIVAGLGTATIGLVLTTFSPRARGRFEAALVIGAAAFALFVVAVTVGALDPGAVTRMIPAVGSDRSFEFRLEFWSRFAEAVTQRPLLGYGTSAATDGFSRLYDGTRSIHFEPHSIYFKAALELGLFGLLDLLAILFLAAIGALRLLAKDRILALAGTAIIGVLVISGLSGPMLDAYPFNLLFWCVVGWIATVPNLGAVGHSDLGGSTRGPGRQATPPAGLVSR